MTLLLTRWMSPRRESPAWPGRREVLVWDEDFLTWIEEKAASSAGAGQWSVGTGGGPTGQKHRVFPWLKAPGFPVSLRLDILLPVCSNSGLHTAPYAQRVFFQRWFQEAPERP